MAIGLAHSVLFIFVTASFRRVFQESGTGICTAVGLAHSVLFIFLQLGGGGLSDWQLHMAIGLANSVFFTFLTACWRRNVVLAAVHGKGLSSVEATTQPGTKR
jgi:hypothetical protein